MKLASTFPNGSFAESSNLSSRMEVSAMTTVDNHEGSPTGISFLDRSMPSAAGSSGVYGIFGSTGTGMTTLACMVAAEGAHRAAKADTPCGQGYWAFVTRQTRELELQDRLAAYLGGLDKSSVENRQPVSPDPDADPHQRLQTARFILDQGLVTLDCKRIAASILGQSCTRHSYGSGAAFGKSRVSGWRRH